MKQDVVGFGALNIDKLYQVNKIAYEEEESYITNSTESCGGSAANTIVGLSRLGLNTGFIGKVATDTEGSLLHNNLQNENVNTNGVIISDRGRSGTVNGYVDGEGQRALYVDPGINDQITYNDVDLGYINNSKLLHLTSFVGKYSDKSINTQKTILNEIDDEIIVSFDPGRLYTERGIKFLEKFLIRTNILLINEAELKQLITGKNYIPNPNEEQKRNEIYEDSNMIHQEFGVDILVVKMGNQGSYVTNGNESYFTKAFNVKCVDSTGAGDAFNAGFLHGYINGDNISKSNIKGNFVASHSVKEHGATDGLPDITQLEDLELWITKYSNKFSQYESYLITNVKYFNNIFL